MKTRIARVRLSSILPLLFLAVSLLACSAGQAVYHGVLMKGHVVDQDESGPVICIGSEDGARVGQTMTVYHNERNPVQKTATPIIRTEAGRIEIVQIFDAHYARAKVLKGQIRIGDTVVAE